MDLAIDFSDLLQAAVADYLPRTEVELALKQKLASAPAGMIVLRGEPGAGKTCLVAAQIQAQGGLRHFLRRGHTEYSLWRDPYGFLTSIGFQLKGRFGESLFPSSIAIDAEQRVHMLQERADLTGIHIQRLISVPWREVNLRVRQDVVDAKGQVAGLRIEEMVEEYHRIPLHIFREMALIAPLRQLKAERPEERVWLWVDALDEGASGEQSIAAVLPNPEELQALGNLWIVVASRPGQHLDRFLRAGAELIDFAEARFDDDNRAFARAYAQRALADTEVKSAVAAAGKNDHELTELVLAQAGDNPLYLEQFFRSARAGGLPILLQGGLPAGLDAIQARLLAAFAEHHGATFSAEIFPVLQVLAAARRPLGRVQLRRFSGLADEQIGETLRALQPYLDVSGQEPGTTYSLYHRSLQETLVAPQHQAQPWHVSAAAANDRMSGAYWQDSAVNLGALDEYGLDFLAAHLAAGGEQSRQRLLELPTSAWRRARRKSAGSNWPFLEDLRRVLQEAQSRPIEEAIPAAARVTLIAGMIQDAERELPAGALKAAVRLGMLQRALGAVSPEMEIRQQVARLAEIASALATAASSTGARPEAISLPEVYYQVLRQALALLQREPAGYDLAHLLEALPLDASASGQEILNQASGLARRLAADWQRPRALIEVARLYTAFDPETAKRWFDAALEDCLALLRSSLTLEQERLVRYWSTLDAQAVAGILPRLRLLPDVYSVRAVLHLGRALEASGSSGALADLTAQAEAKLLAGMTDPYQQVLSEVELARARHDLGESAPAQGALDRARALAAQIGSAQDPEKGQQRPRQAVDASIAIAGLAIELGHPEAQDLLESAWNAYAQQGSFNTRPRELVQLQIEFEPDLLEVYLDQMKVFERQASTRLAAVDALLDSSAPAQLKLARRWLDQALESAERAAPHAWEDGHLIYAAASAMPSENRETALQWARDRLHGDEEVALRLDVLRRMPVDDSQRRDWLAQTLKVWTESCANENFYTDLPHALFHLPLELTEHFVSNPPEIADPIKRYYLMLALGALAERRTPGSGRALLGKTMSSMAQAASKRTPVAMLRAYAAGILWSIDPPRASDLWTEALAWLNSGEVFERDRNQRHYWLTLLTRQLEAGAPDGALQMYLACPEPPMPSGTYTIVVPGALVEPLIQAGLNERDFRLGVALGRSLSGKADASLRESTANLWPPASRALALVGAARAGSAAGRLRLAEAAIEAALQAEPAHLSFLLYAQGIAALSALGAHQRALEHASRAAQTIAQALPVFGTAPAAAYGHAIGLLTASRLAAGEVSDAAALLFSARGAGAAGVYRALAEVCKPFALEAGPEGLANLLEKARDAANVMMG